jgi:hypothetical protein
VDRQHVLEAAADVAVVTVMNGKRISVMECTIRDGRMAKIDLFVEPLDRP